MPRMTIEEEVQRLEGERFALRLDSIVRVEGKDDVDFWSDLFRSSVPSLKFKVFPYSNVPTVNSTGKPNVLKFAAFASKKLLLCVDSDYDYLLQTSTIPKSDYILQTYTYAIENHRCSATQLVEWCKDVANINEVNDIDFEEILATYSKNIYPNLLFSLYSVDTDVDVFSTEECGKLVSLPQHFKDINEVLSEIAAKKAPNAENVDVSKLSIFEQKMQERGLNEANAYLFLRCHNLEDNFVFPLVTHIQRAIRNEKNNSLSSADKRAYEKGTKNVATAIKTPTIAIENEWYEQIQKDIKAIHT